MTTPNLPWYFIFRYCPRHPTGNSNLPVCSSIHRSHWSTLVSSCSRPNQVQSYCLRQQHSCLAKAPDWHVQRKKSWLGADRASLGPGLIPHRHFQASATGGQKGRNISLPRPFLACLSRAFFPLLSCPFTLFSRSISPCRSCRSATVALLDGSF